MNRTSLVAAASCLLTVLGGMPALGHGTFVDARPLPGIAVGGTVDEVELLFPEGIVPTDSRIEVRGPDGSRVPPTGRITAPIASVARVGIRPLTEPGEYRVVYSIPATDGTVFAGDFQFTFDPAAEPLRPLPYGRGRVELVALLGLASALVVGGGLLVARRSRRAGGAHP